MLGPRELYLDRSQDLFPFAWLVYAPWGNTAHPAGGGGCPPHCCGGGGLFAYGLYCCCWCCPCPGYWFHDMSAGATVGVQKEKPRRGDGGMRIAVEESRPVTRDVAPESVAIPLRMQIGSDQEWCAERWAGI